MLLSQKAHGGISFSTCPGFKIDRTGMYLLPRRTFQSRLQTVFIELFVEPVGSTTLGKQPTLSSRASPNTAPTSPRDRKLTAWWWPISRPAVGWPSTGDGPPGQRPLDLGPEAESGTPLDRPLGHAASGGSQRGLGGD